MIQKRLNFAYTKQTRVAFLMKEDELPNPESVGLLRPQTEMSAAARGGDLVEQARRGRGKVTP
jgi:hypothetical protein